MKNLSLLFVSILFFQLIIFPQAPDTVWTRSIGGIADDQGKSVIQTTDGGFVITGYTESFGAGGKDVGLMKLDSNGNLLWIKTFGGTLDDEGNSVIQTTDGNYVITGYTFLPDPVFGQYVGLMKVDPNGNLIWLKTFGNVDDSYVGNCAIQTTDGGFVITGYTSNPPLPYDVLLIKTDSNGNQIWSKTYGGNQRDEGYSVVQTNDGGFVITGETNSFGAGLEDVLLIKTDSNGNLTWLKTFGGTAYDGGRFVIEATDGNFVIAGTTISFGAGVYDVGLIKVDQNGNLIWIKTFGGTSSDFGFSLIQASDGNFVITGRTESFGSGWNDVGLMKVDQNGNLVWITAIGTIESEVGFSVKQISDGGYIITGYNHTVTEEPNVYVVKVKPDITDVEDESVVSNFLLAQNYPNPFNPNTTIKYQVPELSFVTIKVYDLLGNEIAALVNEEKLAGKYEVAFNATGLPSGVYYYQLKTGSFFETKKMIMMK